jgi:carboxylesterase type B
MIQTGADSHLQIVQSIGTDPIPSPKEYEACFANVTATIGCPNNSSKTMTCLRAAPLSSIVTAVNGKPSTCKFLPVIDGDFLRDYPSRLLAEGKFHKMPFMGGHCTDDGSIFVGAPSGITNTTAGFISALRRRYTTLVCMLLSALVILG